MKWENIDQSAEPVVLESSTKLTVTPGQELPGGDSGITVGQGVTITLSLQVPNDLSPSWPHNGNEITNEASVTANNSQDASDQAKIKVDVVQTVNVGATKTWAPATANVQPGAASTITMGVSNGSNIPVDTLIIQEPKAAADGAATLDPSNPFTITEFTGFGNSALPAGATAVTTEVYVHDATADTYSWQTVSSDAAEPSIGSVAPGDVAGVRLTYTGTDIAVGAGTTIPLNLKQLAKARGTDDAVDAGRIDNVVEGIASKEGVGEKSTDANASHSLTMANIGANITKNIAPERVPAGAYAIGTLVGKNKTSVGANSLTISDRDFFVEGEIEFGGFVDASGAPSKPTLPSVTPAGTVLTGEILYTSFDGATETVMIPVNGNPGPPSFGYKNVAGFDVVWTAPAGAVITNGGSETNNQGASTVRFKINTTEKATEAQNPRPAETNTAKVKVETPYGEATAQASDDIVIVSPDMEVDITKSVAPATPVEPGDQVLAQLKPSYDLTSAGITADTLVVEDSWAQSNANSDPARDNGGFWNAFDLYSIAPTGVPANTGLVIDVQLADGTWHTVRTLASSGSSRTTSLTHEQLTAALPDGTDTSALTGVKFTFTNPQGVSSTLIPNLMFEARENLRDGTGKTYTTDGVPTEYVNVATVVGSATNNTTGAVYTDDDSAEGVASIVGSQNGGTGIGPGCYIDKDWKLAATGQTAARPLPALSNDHAWTALYWRVLQPDAEATPPQGPATKVVLQDHNNITGTSAETVYDAFNLVGMTNIQNSSTAGSNGWALRWDKVTDIEIFYNGGWVRPAATAPPASPMATTLMST